MGNAEYIAQHEADMLCMQKQDFMELLRRRVQDAGSQSALAKELGISDSYLSDVLTQRREPGEAMLAPMGIERVVVYREAGE